MRCIWNRKNKNKFLGGLYNNGKCKGRGRGYFLLSINGSINNLTNRNIRT